MKSICIIYLQAPTIGGLNSTRKSRNIVWCSTITDKRWHR